MLLSEFDYELPEELIAQKPIEPRNFSRLMVLDPARRTIGHEHFFDLQKFLTAGDTLIFNDIQRYAGHTGAANRAQGNGSTCRNFFVAEIGRDDLGNFG